MKKYYLFFYDLLNKMIYFQFHIIDNLWDFPLKSNFFNFF